jgi:nitroimidazol reductase NimA-like FMN-containing flavoprotein (pyridoxamine 5'-phosphate oxidase superfamily)
MPAEPADELLVQLDPDACRRLLAASEFGRLAVVVDGRPHLVVLNYLVDGADVLFRTTPGAELARLTEGGTAVHAVFEVDSAFPAGRTGWSVIVTGLVRRETDARRVDLARAAISAWAEGDRDLVLACSTDELSGRQVGPL